jgi:hypothetical protein
MPGIIIRAPAHVIVPDDGQQAALAHLSDREQRFDQHGSSQQAP